MDSRAWLWLIVTSFVACGGPPSEPALPTTADVVAVINGEAISQEDWALAKSFYADGQGQLVRPEREILDELIGRRLLLAQVRRSDLLDDSEVMDPIDERLANVRSFSEFENEMVTRMALVHAWFSKRGLALEDFAVIREQIDAFAAASGIPERALRGGGEEKARQLLRRKLQNDKVQEILAKLRDRARISISDRCVAAIPDPVMVGGGQMPPKRMEAVECADTDPVANVNGEALPFVWATHEYRSTIARHRGRPGARRQAVDNLVSRWLLYQVAAAEVTDPIVLNEIEQSHRAREHANEMREHRLREDLIIESWLDRQDRQTEDKTKLREQIVGDLKANARIFIGSRALIKGENGAPDQAGSRARGIRRVHIVQPALGPGVWPDNDSSRIAFYERESTHHS